MPSIKIDKSEWGPGPWQDEPDRIEWEHLGYRCLMRRNENIGNWCGYVAVGPTHPAFKKRYDEVNVAVHGGLTYADTIPENRIFSGGLGLIAPMLTIFRQD